MSMIKKQHSVQQAPRVVEGIIGDVKDGDPPSIDKIIDHTRLSDFREKQDFMKKTEK